MNDRTLPYIYLIVVWFSNINDLIRGKWFFSTVESIIFWNFIGILALIYIILSYKNKKKK